MNPQIKNRLKRTALLSFIAVLIGVGIGWWQVKNEQAGGVTQTSSSTAMPGAQMDAHFTLTDHTGRAVTEKDYAGSYKLIYFGFTYCPAICPTELQKITRVMNMLPEKQAAKIQPLFITVDPERDTVPVMRDYVSLFHPRLTGLTGSRAQIDEALQNHRVFARKAQEEGMDDYTMDHSSFIYLMSPDDKVLALYRIQDDADYITQGIKTRL